MDFCFLREKYIILNQCSVIITITPSIYILTFHVPWSDSLRKDDFFMENFSYIYISSTWHEGKISEL